MAVRRQVRKQILTALQVLEVLAAAGCSGNKPKHPSSITSPAPSAGTTNPAAESGSAALVQEVQRELSAIRVTRYQHTTRVDERSGGYFYDCSGLLDYALDRARPADLKPIPHSNARPPAADIEGYLHRGLTGAIDGWQALARVDALGPGDVVAWQATEDSTTGDTGHVMVVLEAPTRNSARAGTTGRGTGTIGLVVDQSGAPAASTGGAESARRPSPPRSPSVTPGEVGLPVLVGFQQP